MKTAGNEHIALLIELYLDGECSPVERKTLETAIADDPALQLEVQQARAVRRAFDRDVNMLSLPGADKDIFLAKVAASAGGIGESVTATAGAAAALGLSASGSAESGGTSAAVPDSTAVASSGGSATVPLVGGAGSAAAAGSSTAGVLGGSGTAWIAGVAAALILAVSGFLVWNSRSETPATPVAVKTPEMAATKTNPLQAQDKHDLHYDTSAETAGGIQGDAVDATSDIASDAPAGDAAARDRTHAGFGAERSDDYSSAAASLTDKTLNTVDVDSAPELPAGETFEIPAGAFADERSEPVLITAASLFDFDRTVNPGRDFLAVVLNKLTTVPESPRWSFWATGGYVLSSTEPFQSPINPDYSLALHYRVNEEIMLGLLGGNESMAQSEINGAVFTPFERYTYGAAALTYLPVKLRFERVEPYLQIVGGIHSGGLLVKSQLGFQRPLYGPFRAHFAVEGTLFRGLWQDIGKVGVISGIEFSF